MVYPKLFFPFEKEKLRDLVIKKAINYTDEFNTEENDALNAALKYSSQSYIDQSAIKEKLFVCSVLYGLVRSNQCGAV